jgi:hypothetical protein
MSARTTVAIPAKIFQVVLTNTCSDLKQSRKTPQCIAYVKSNAETILAEDIKAKYSGRGLPLVHYVWLAPSSDQLHSCNADEVESKEIFSGDVIVSWRGNRKRLDCETIVGDRKNAGEIHQSEQVRWLSDTLRRRAHYRQLLLFSAHR